MKADGKGAWFSLGEARRLEGYLRAAVMNPLLDADETAPIDRMLDELVAVLESFECAQKPTPVLADRRRRENADVSTSLLNPILSHDATNASSVNSSGGVSSMKRMAVAVGLSLALVWGSASADTIGARRMQKANAYCARLGAAYGKGGYSERELRRLAAVPCKVDREGRWTSAKVFTQ